MGHVSLLALSGNDLTSHTFASRQKMLSVHITGSQWMLGWIHNKCVAFWVILTDYSVMLSIAYIL